jgi:nicotinate-nucleotide adenylyltransferase
MRLGIFGGSFDPIHLGHLLAASESAEQLGLDQVIFVTSARPPHKTPQAPAEARYEMVLLATVEDPRFQPSRLELDRPGPSYTVETLEQVRALAPNAELFFITGADAFAEAAHWHQAERLFELATLVAVTRPGYPPRMAPPFRHRAHLLEIPGFQISSTEIRLRLSQGRTVRYLVPPAVEAYLVRHQLYRGAQS